MFSKVLKSISAVFAVLAVSIVGVIESGVIAISVFLVVYLFIAQPHQVDGLSMFPTFHHADFVLTDKVAYQLHSPERGDVVVFHAPPQAQCPAGTGCDYIKRVIALPGDSVEVKNNVIYINGQILQEPYLDSTILTTPGAFSQNRVMKMRTDEYFVVGDNRPHSSDSRTWGPVTPKEIVGKVIFRYWPISSAQAITKPSYSL
ncbi:MAG: Signal peptidase I [Microgenomates group bacterium GW2011_GWF2_45_18]|nr:MAG: Signal peptidase I [Microgenomates group bacterium GW2011_GWF1_44_10]KKU02372.1 MAG: Signal peptidase I [Microgenomates group bacterium GW2011_GWF2_45_18]HAU99161.1 signal peptidase I [Candidatus Paceibacterota bacterium]HAX01691.1 signal peptidase I [Candidatus Paceibacterota bacterium]